MEPNGPIRPETLPCFETEGTFSRETRGEHLNKTETIQWGFVWLKRWGIIFSKMSSEGVPAPSHLSEGGITFSKVSRAGGFPPPSPSEIMGGSPSQRCPMGGVAPPIPILSVGGSPSQRCLMRASQPPPLPSAGGSPSQRRPVQGVAFSKATCGRKMGEHLLKGVV